MVGVLSELCRHPKKRAVVDLDRRRCLLVFCCFCVAWWCLVKAQYQQRRHSKTELWQNQKSKKSKNQARRASSMEFPCFHRDERRKGRKQFFKFRSILVAVRFLSENAELRTCLRRRRKKEGGRLSLTNTTSCVTTLIVHMRGHSHTGVISYRMIACCWCRNFDPIFSYGGISINRLLGMLKKIRIVMQFDPKGHRHPDTVYTSRIVHRTQNISCAIMI